jgi:hypothetical protein
MRHSQFEARQPGINLLERWIASACIQQNVIAHRRVMICRLSTVHDISGLIWLGLPRPRDAPVKRVMLGVFGRKYSLDQARSL